MTRSPLPVLVVEDDEEIGEVLAELLEAEGHPAFRARDGAEGIRMIETLPRPLLVVLDLVMPALGGPDVLRAIETRPNAEQIRVLVVSGDQHRLDEAAAHPRVDGTLCKPFRVAALLAWIDTAQSRAAAAGQPAEP